MLLVEGRRNQQVPKPRTKAVQNWEREGEGEGEGEGGRGREGTRGREGGREGGRKGGRGCTKRCLVAQNLCSPKAVGVKLAAGCMRIADGEAVALVSGVRLHGELDVLAGRDVRKDASEWIPHLNALASQQTGSPEQVRYLPQPKEVTTYLKHNTTLQPDTTTSRISPIQG